MADLVVPNQKESSALQTLNSTIQLHFEKTLEKKRAIDLQKKHLQKLYHLFFILLSLILLPLSSSTTLQCRHCWISITLLTFAHLVFYVSLAQTLRCINGFKYQRRCHKLTLGLATEKLRQVKIRARTAGRLDAATSSSSRVVDVDEIGGDAEEDGEFEIGYQEPPESYFGKFKRNWALHFGFLILVYGFMLSSSVVLLCY